METEAGLAVLAVLQGTYFAAAGVWPLVSMGTFERVTGPKIDDWLVKTVGVLIAVIGVTLVLAGVRRDVTAEIVTLAVGSALALTAVDVIYVAQGRIARIYLLDAVGEALLVSGWALALLLAR
jgi:energy-converting hydrogenase Eha subunit E